MNPRMKTFSASDAGQLVREELVAMTKSSSYNTATSYSSTDPSGLTFVDKQMKYMSQYPTMNYHQYVSNLKMKTRVALPVLK